MIAIAIDGPSGAGKSTLARRLAAWFGYIYVDTGAMYRTVGLCAVKNGVNPKDADGVAALLPRTEIRLAYQDGTQHVFLNGEDVSGQIRTEQISMAASDVSAIPAVRAFLLDTQRSLAEKNNVLMDGRDIGTVILPHAQIKIFLTASPEERARRRYEELQARGETVSYETVLEDVRRRDDQDSNRALAPLKPAPDAVLVDTTGCSFEESFERLKQVIQERL
ncbi:(d)CMP kinase [Ruthenibacterium sp. CLA-JM-H11]|uniref:Cytidylate kinase n=1 Tax=Ruthenibacterium intestinale TaxID=3133163 RepID=A0ABV1GGK1_9FIRM